MKDNFNHINDAIETDRNDPIEKSIENVSDSSNLSDLGAQSPKANSERDDRMSELKELQYSAKK